MTTLSSTELRHDLNEAELAEFIRHTPKRRSAWKWVRHPDGRRILNPEVLHDGHTITSATSGNVTAAAEIVRAVFVARQAFHERRSRAAKKAAETRARRKELQVYRIAKELLAGGCLLPSSHCRICKKAVTDPESYARGIGSDCWQGVLGAMERQRKAAADPALPAAVEANGE
jgi:hypothetical protein